jgi:hypothetical protein
MSEIINDNRATHLRAGLEAAEAAINGIADDDELVAQVAYVVALAVEHRLVVGKSHRVSSLLMRITDEAGAILSDWSVGKTAGLKRQFCLEIDCSHSSLISC